jgi:pullulanase
MKNKVFIPLMLGALLALCSCGQTSSNNSTSSESVCVEDPSPKVLDPQTTKDVNYPSTLPSFSEPTVLIHYRRNDAKYTSWMLWLWVKGTDGADYTFNYQDDFGVIAAYPLSQFPNATTNTLGLIIKTEGWGSKDVQHDVFVDFSTITPDSNKYNVYFLSGDDEVYTTPTLNKNDVITKASFVDDKNVAFAANKNISAYSLKENGVQIASGTDLCAKEGSIALPNAADVTKQYTLALTFRTSSKEKSTPVLITSLYKTDAFNKAFTYTGDLGAIYTSEKTTFKVWSPVSQEIKLRLYNKGTPAEEKDPYQEVALSEGEKGVWSQEVQGDLGGKYYTYVVTNAQFSSTEIVDPYAKSAGANGVRGMIVDFSKTNPDGWSSIEPHAYDRKELTVWETHVADVTSSATWTGNEANRKRYLGLCEEGTTYTSSTYNKTVKTGFDHIKELGVNAVQLMPIFDSANDELNPSFNWGYNPLNYNCLDGSYSSNPKDGYTRIREFKQVVSAYNKAGINIIMDVVYNHVAGLTGSNFDVLVPGYYFRYNSDGSASNGSGCGNETASDLPMFRKFMEDSTSFWAQEYKLGGFRFDLMGLHDLTTMNELTAKLKTINPKIVVYGEPWTGGTTTLDSNTQAKQANGNAFVGYGAFNDGMRDALIKGGLHDKSERGWVTSLPGEAVTTGDVNQIVAGLKGTTLNNGVSIADPDKTVNYVTCHDNYTLKDRLVASGGVSSNSTIQAQINVLANSFVFTSQGTTFMLAGDEFNRTKGGNSNSYNASYKVNELDYNLKARFYSEFENYQKLIALKQDVDGLHLDKTNAAKLSINSLAGGEIISHTITDTTNKREYVVYHTNGVTSVARPSIDLSGYTLYMDNLGLERSGSFTPNSYEVVIGYKTIA